MASIKQNLAGQPLPDFRNAGVMLRILLGVNLLALAPRWFRARGCSDSLQHYIDMAAWVQPLLLFNLALLALLGNSLQRPPSGSGARWSSCWPPGRRSCCRRCGVC
jgi:two-component system sensor histidine kinase AlgZ